MIVKPPTHDPGRETWRDDLTRAFELAQPLMFGALIGWMFVGLVHAAASYACVVIGLLVGSAAAVNAQRRHEQRMVRAMERRRRRQDEREWTLPPLQVRCPKCGETAEVIGLEVTSDDDSAH